MATWVTGAAGAVPGDAGRADGAALTAEYETGLRNVPWTAWPLIVTWPTLPAFASVMNTEYGTSPEALCTAPKMPRRFQTTRPAKMPSHTRLESPWRGGGLAGGGTRGAPDADVAGPGAGGVVIGRSYSGRGPRHRSDEGRLTRLASRPWSASS